MPGVQYPKTWFEALAARMLGDASKAESAFGAARVQAASAVIADATSARKLGLLAMIDAGLGHREEAVREARRAYDLSSKVAIDAPIAACNLAVVYALDGPIRSCSCCSGGMDNPSGRSERAGSAHLRRFSVESGLGSVEK